MLSTSCVTLEPTSEPIHDDKRNTIIVPRLVVLVQNFVAGCQGICETLRFRELIRLTMDLGSAVLADRLARITNRTIRVFRKVRKRIMAAFSFIKAYPATAAASSLGDVLGIARGQP